MWYYINVLRIRQNIYLTYNSILGRSTDEDKWLLFVLVEYMEVIQSILSYQEGNLEELAQAIDVDLRVLTQNFQWWLSLTLTKQSL